MVQFLAFVAIALGSYIQSSIGFGLALIAAPVLFFISPDYVPVPITLSVLVLSLANVLSHRELISLAGLKYAIIGRIPGSVLGALLLVWIDTRLLGLWVGVTVLIAVLMSLRIVAFSPTSGHLLIAGFFSGFMGTSSSIGGPPMVMIMQHQEAKYIRANLAVFFLAGSVLSLLLLALVDRFNTQHVILSLPLIPAALLGYWFARHTLHLVSKQMLRFFSLVLCSLCGIAAVLSYWF
jgi:uncharacterized protein